MPTSAYPGGIDNLTDPTSTSAMNNPSHATQHTNANDAIQALEAFTAPFPPAIVTNVLGQTFPDWHATGTLVTLSSGVMYLTGIHLQANLKITNIWFMFGSTTLSTPTHLWSCLLDNTVTTPKLLANSADTLTTVTPSVSVANQIALTTPFTLRTTVNPCGEPLAISDVLEPLSPHTPNVSALDGVAPSTTPSCASLIPDDGDVTVPLINVHTPAGQEVPAVSAVETNTPFSDQSANSAYVRVTAGNTHAHSVYPVLTATDPAPLRAPATSAYVSGEPTGVIRSALSEYPVATPGAPFAAVRVSAPCCPE